MKANLLYLLAMVAAFFTVSCSNDSDKTLDGVPGSYSGRNLTITVNGSVYSDANAKVDVSGSDADNMTFDIHNVVFGQELYTVGKCQVRVDDFDARIFAGESETDCNSVKIQGKISAGKMVLEIQQEGLTGNYSSANGSGISINGKQAASTASVEITGMSSADVKMYLRNIIVGVEELEISSVTIVPVDKATPGTKAEIIVVRKFTAEYKDSYRDIAISGSVQNGVMNIEITSKNLGDAIGKWKIAQAEGESYPDILLEVEGPDDLQIMGMDVSYFVIFVKSIVGQLGAEYLNALQYIDFKEDGSIALLVHDPANGGAVIEIPNEMIPEGALGWYMAEGKIVFVVDATMIDMIPGGYGEIIKGFFETKGGYIHVPLNYRKETTGGISIYLDKDFLAAALPVIEANLPDEILNDPTFGEMIQTILADLKVALTKCSVFNVGFPLEKVQ